MKKPQIAWHTMLAQLGDAGQRRAPVPITRHRFNPRPPGVIRPGSTTDAVLEIFTARPGQLLVRARVLALTGCTASAVDWALLFLRQQGRIECIQDGRNPRYLRYRLQAGAALPPTVATQEVAP